MSGSFNQQLLISIVSFCDKELVPTIADALKQAKNPSRITFSIVEQDTESNKQEIEELVSSFNASLIYKHVQVEETQGVVWARSWAAKPLTSLKYDYYLQLDSHMRFSFHYDSFLINSYEHALDQWGPFVWTAYCPNYSIDEGSYILDDVDTQSTFAIVYEKFASVLVGCTKPFDKSNLYGEIALQVSGHFLFGDAKIFIDNPFDPNLYWEGEESTYAARLYCKGIKTVSPPHTYFWHKYESDITPNPTRKKHSQNETWENQEFMEEKINRLATRGLARCKDFWDNNISDGYGACSKEQLHAFLYLENRTPPKHYATIGFSIEENDFDR